MPRNPDRVFDKTHLSIDLAEQRQLVHRDYIAHCLRWSHTVKYLLTKHRYKDSIILDVGCGKEIPLAKMLYVNKMSPLAYVGVDINKLEIPDMLSGKQWIRLLGETDFCSVTLKDIGQEDAQECGAYFQPDLITSFEVLEHVTPKYCRQMLVHMRELLDPAGAVIVSTPCYNGSAAGNHINEMTHEALGAMLEDLGYAIDAVYGTFASQKDYEGELGPWAQYNVVDGTFPTLRGAYDELKDYYDSNLLAVLFAPLFPRQSRNCLWRLSPTQPDHYVRQYPTLAEVPGPWSQHERWQELAG